jgi:GntR family transcriptional regulator/MocR family aminotransferase
VKALDPGGRVLNTGTFSKMLMPGLRMGYLVAQGPVFALLTERKRVNDLTTSPLLQRTLEAYVTVGRYQAHLRRSCRLYKRRRDAMLAAVARHLPPEVTFQPPQGGLFLWLDWPPRFPPEALEAAAAAEGVEYAAGARFFPDPADGAGFLRLNFAVQNEEAIEEGIRRLGRAFEQAKQ